MSQRIGEGPFGPCIDGGARGAAGGDPLCAANMMRLVEGLALGHKDRVFGTPKGEKAAKWLAGQMKAAGLVPANGDSYLQRFSYAIGDQDLIGQNVAGMIPGTDPALKDEVVIVTAHHDVVESTHQGANDNATGCAGVLAIAKALRDHPPKRTVLFMTFDGEEGLRRGGTYHPGRKGSRHYAADPLFPINKTALMVNMDELGMVHLETQSRDLIYQWASGDRFAQKILKEATEKTDALGTSVDGYPEQPREAQFFTTDAEPLYRLGVPVINLLSGRYLLNHTEADTLSLMIPERMEQYVRRAFACVSEAANHAISIADYGVTPGGMMATYPLVRERRGQAGNVSSEERLRLNGLVAKMPALKDAAGALMKIVADPAFQAELRAKTGLELRGTARTLLNEPTLAKVREHKARLLEAYRDIPKGDAARRRAACAPINLLSGVEGILSGGLYVTLIQGGDYYLQQVPDRLLELRRGAIRLGRGELVKGLITADHTRKFTTEVSADRAVALAKEALPGLQLALSQAVFALFDPGAAAASERPVMSEDLEALAVAMTRAARTALGDEKDDSGDLKRLALATAFLETTVGRVKGSGDKWLRRFAESNAMTDFSSLVAAMKLAPDRAADLARDAARIEQNLLPPAIDVLREAVPAFYARLTELAFGAEGRAASIEALAELSKEGAIARRAGDAAHRIAQPIDPNAIARAAGDPTVERLGELQAVLSSTLRFQALFRPAEKGGSRPLDQGATLHEVKAAIDRVREAVDKLPDGGAVAGELDFWSGWLSAFLDLEPSARGQSKERREAASGGLRALEATWPKVRATIDPAKLGLEAVKTEHAAALLRKLDARIDLLARRDPPERDPRLEAAARRVRPFADASHTLQNLFATAEPNLTNAFSAAVEQIANQLGEPSVRGLRQAEKKLAELQAARDVELGRKERSGPMGVLSLRARAHRNDP